MASLGLAHDLQQVRNLERSTGRTRTFSFRGNPDLQRISTHRPDDCVHRQSPVAVFDEL